MARLLIIVIRTALGIALAMAGIVALMFTPWILSHIGASLFTLGAVIVLSVVAAVAAGVASWKLLSTTLQLPAVA